LTSLEEFSQRLLGNIKTFRENGDKSGADVVNNSCTACLAHLAVLYEVVGRMDPVARDEMYNLCDSALQRLGTHTSKPLYDEYTYLDLLLGVRLSYSFLTVVAQTEGWGRTLGRNH